MQEEVIMEFGGWSLDNPVFASYVLYSAILALKMLVVAETTVYYRLKKTVWVNPEDSEAFAYKKEVKVIDEDVERVRRAHQNDLENIPVFWILGLLFVLTSPSPTVAMWLYRIYCITRIAYSVLYIRGSKIRPYAFIVGMCINIYMAVSIIWVLSQ